MIDAEPLIRDELAHLSPLGGFEHADWSDVLRRAELLVNADQVEGRRRKWPQRRVALGLVAAAAIGLLAAPAFGLRLPFLDFFSSDKAPKRVVVGFARLNVGAPRGMSPNVISGETRRVTTYRLRDGTLYPLWVAPTRKGGFCFLLGNAGGCTHRGDGPLDLGGDHNARTIDLSTINGHILAGNVFDKRIAELEVQFKSGKKAPIPVLWVSPPIDAGFFLYDVPEAQVAAIVALDGSGKEVARLASRFRPPPAWSNPRKVADLAQKHVILRSGRVSIAIAPSRTGGDCYWLQVDRQAISSGCAPPRFLTMPLAGGLNHGSGFTVFSAQVKPSVARVELYFQNGTIVRLQPVEGHVLYNIPPSQWPPGQRLRLAIAYGSHERILARQHIDPTDMGVYDCARPKPIGAGETACP